MTGPLHVTRWGGSGERVVLIHGSAQGSSVGGDHHFAAQERLAARGFQLLVPDRPGHGRSPSPGRPDDAAADSAWAADLLGAGAHLVGHSFGGCVALATASRRPEAVRSLTLIEPAMQRVAASDPRVARFVLRMMVTMLLPWPAATRARRIAALLGIPAEIGGARGAEELARMGKAMRRLVLPSRATLERQLEELRQREIPLLVVTGGWNAAFEAVGDAVAARGGGRRLVIRSKHHFPQLVSDEFNERFVEFAAIRTPLGKGDPSMATARVTRTLDVPADRLWRLVAAFGDTSWMPGPPKVELAGSGPGMERRIHAGEKVIHERLESVDEAGRTLVYTIPVNVPFPVTDYRATMRVRAAGAGSELDWSVSFTPAGASEEDARKAIEGMYGVMIGWIEARAKTA